MPKVHSIHDAKTQLSRLIERECAGEEIVIARGKTPVVLESQEIVELALKALLRASGIDPPRIHDVSEVLLAERSRFPQAVQSEVEQLAEASRQLRRDRELAFYGAEDLTPSGFYTRGDAERSRASARRTVEVVEPHVPPPPSPDRPRL